MAHSSIKRRFNVPYKYYRQESHDGEDFQYFPAQDILGFGVEETKAIINYLGDRYESNSQIYFDGDNLLALDIRGGDFIESDFLGKILVQGVRRYFARTNRINTALRVELIVIYI